MLGKLLSLVPVPYSRKTLVTLELDAQAEDIEKFTGKKLKVEIKQFRAHRTLSQNGYYWQLLTEVAAHKEIRTSTAYQHNLLLRQHPRFEIVNGKNVFVQIQDTDEAEKSALEATTFHIAPTDVTSVGTNGTKFRTYRLLRGSSDYTTEEMSVLLEDLIEKAKELGIDTATPEERERMRQYDEQQEQRKSRRA